MHIFIGQECNAGAGYAGVPYEENELYRSLLELEPPKFLSSFDNPCWIECMPDNETLQALKVEEFGFGIFQRALAAHWENYTITNERWRIRCLPKIYLIGMAKSGTTDLFRRYGVNYISLILMVII